MAKILLAEDDPHLSESLSELLKLDGHHVQTVKDGQTAWETLQEEPFDVLITDYYMPRLEGDMLIENIQNTPELDSLFIIVMSGYETRPTKRINAIFYKPFEIQKILTAVKGR